MKTNEALTVATSRLYLRPVPCGLRREARRALESGDVVGWLSKASNEASVLLVRRNAPYLRGRGLLEFAFVEAVTATRTNNHLDYASVAALIPMLDREKLVACGKLPSGRAPWRIYRGVAGRGPARRIRGFSWSSDFERALWFAERHSGRLADPAVYETTVTKKELLFCWNKRREEEYFVVLPRNHPVRRIAVVGPSVCSEEEA